MNFQTSEGIWKLTGQRRFRQGWFNRIILQVEETERTGFLFAGKLEWTGANRRWRDAKLLDLPCEEWLRSS